ECSMCQCRSKVNLSRICCILTRDQYLLSAFTNIKCIKLQQLIAFTVCFNNSRTTDVNKANFSALKEIFCFQCFSISKLKLFIDWTSAANDHAIMMAIHHVNFFCFKKVFNQKALT